MQIVDLLLGGILNEFLACTLEDKKKKKKNAQKREGWEFSGGPLVRTLSFTAEGAGLILGQGTRIPQTGLYLAKKKKQNKKRRAFC